MRKICLSAIDSKLEGYEPIDFLLTSNPLEQLNDRVADGEAGQIVAENVLEFISIPETQATIQAIVRKLSHGGTIIFSCTDIYMLCRDILDRDLNIQQINEVVFGPPKRRAIHTALGVTQLLVECGLQILSRRFDGNRFYVEAKRQ